MNPRRGLRQRIARVLYLGFIAYLVIVLGVLIFQRRLIYFPTRLPVDGLEQMAAEHGFVPWRGAAGQIIGWKIPATGTATGSVLIVHGNAGCALNRDYLAQPIHDAAPVNVFVLEYPGYGARAGAPSKSSLLEAAEEAFRELPPSLSKFVVSESIGAGVACDLAKHHPQDIAGMALFAPYQNLASVAQRQMPFLPAYFLLLDRFNPAECLKHYGGPVVFIVAGADEIIAPVSGRRLFEGFSGPKQLQVIPGARHNEIAEQSPDWWRKILAFWRSPRKA